MGQPAREIHRKSELIRFSMNPNVRECVLRSLSCLDSVGSEVTVRPKSIDRARRISPMDRRTFFFTAARGGACLAAGTGTAAAFAREPGQTVTIIDLDRCDGCAEAVTPACVVACRTRNAGRYPEPTKPLQPYWPQKGFEDFSEERDRMDRLTPYNWIFVQKIEHDGRTTYVPRRCMHCYDAPCRKLCPFGAIEKTHEGMTKIDSQVCFGGAKCRDVCPWGIPQRQAGVGIYLKVAPKFAGGGVMYKCDGCADRPAGEAPACVRACPNGAMYFGPYNEMVAKLESIASGRHVYGRRENGGTATWYVSSTSFETLNDALVKARGPRTPQGEPGLQKVEPRLDESRLLAGAALIAPIAAVGGAVLLRQRRQNEGDES